MNPHTEHLAVNTITNNKTEAMSTGAHKEERKTTSISASNTNGRYFAYALVPMIIFAVIAFTVHLSIALQGYGWNRNSVALALKLRNFDHDSKSLKNTISGHAISGCIVASLAIIQLALAIRMSSSSSQRNAVSDDESIDNTENCLKGGTSALEPRSTWVQRAHKYIGHILVSSWSIVALVGLIASILKYYVVAQRNAISISVHAIAFLPTFIGAVSNLGIGYWEVSSKSTKSTRDMVLHKGCMFFGMFWVLHSGLDECLTALFQFYKQDCYIDDYGQVWCSFVSQLLQLLTICATIVHFDRALFQNRFVWMNLGVFAIRGTIFGVATSFLEETCS